MHTTKISIDDHLAEYCIAKFGEDFTEPVRFPDNLDLYHTIADLTQKMPVGVYQVTGNLEIVLPAKGKSIDSIRKNPAVYNYLSANSCRIINNKIKILFWAELHEYVDTNRHLKGVTIIECVYTFMCRYRITKITEDALVKNYQRWKNVVRPRDKRPYRKSIKK